MKEHPTHTKQFYRDFEKEIEGACKHGHRWNYGGFYEGLHYYQSEKYGQPSYLAEFTEEDIHNGEAVAMTKYGCARSEDFCKDYRKKWRKKFN